MKRPGLTAFALGQVGRGDLPAPARATLRMPGQRPAQTEEECFAAHPVLDTIPEVGRFDGVPVREADAWVPDDVDGVKMIEMTQGLNRAPERDAVEGFWSIRVGQRELVFGASAHGAHGDTSRRAIQPRVASAVRTLLVAGVLAGAGLAGGCLSDEPGLGDASVSDVDSADALDPDRQDPACKAAAVPVPGGCGEPVIVQVANRGQEHVPDGTPIVYADSPPSSGDHRPAWGRWGEYSYLPPQRWLHNLEHGGIAFLYDPCVASPVVDTLRTLAKALPADDSGPFRWVLTPYPGLGTGVAVVAWEWTWQASCVDAVNQAALQSFITEHYRNGPEDVAVDGSYATDWIGR